MRFQMLERLPEGDPEAVLRAMEEGLREISSELSREGHRILLSGLGPSPRAKNRRDRAVIDVTVEDSATIIQVDATYQASAFLGDIPQNAVVEAKLRRVFDEARARMGLKTEAPPPPSFSPAAPAASREESSAAAMRFSTAMNGNGAASIGTMTEPPAPVMPPIIESKPVETVLAEVPSFHAAEQSPALPASETKSAVIEPLAEAPATTPEAPPVITEVPPAITVEAAAPSVVDKETVTTPEAIEPQTSKIAPAPIEKETASVSAQPVSRPSPLDETRQDEPKTPVFAAFQSDPKSSEENAPKSSRKLRWGAWAAAIIVLVLAPAAWLYLPQEFGRSSSPQNPPPAPSQPTPAQPTPVQSLPEQPKASQPGTEDDPQAMIKDWETALRSTDPALQASFYADPVDRYFLRHNVKKEDVVADKQAAIAKRQGDWTVTLEQIKVRQQSAISTATVRLIKHYAIHLDGRLTSQWYVPSQLQLKRDDGRWQITSERDLGWANTMDEIDY